MPSTVSRGIFSATPRRASLATVSPSELTKACEEAKETVESGSGETPFGGEAWGRTGDGFEGSRESAEWASPQLIPKDPKSKRATKSNIQAGKQERPLLVPLEMTLAKATTEV